MRNLTMIACLLCTLVAGGLTATAAERTPEISIPLGDWNGKPIVELTIGDKGPFRFILDSGADVTVIDHAVAALLDSKPLGQTEIGSPLGGTVTATRLELLDVHLDKVALGSIEVLDIDLAAVLGSGDAPVGVLATADVGNRSLIFDFATNHLSLSETLLPVANKTHVFDFCSASGKPSLNLEVGGQTHCVNLDTGSPAVLTLPLSTAEALPLSGKPVVRGRARLVGGEFEVWGARLDGDLRIGEIVVPNPDLGFIEAAPIGNLGQGFLRTAELTLDHVNHRLSLRVAGMPEATASAGSGPQVRRVVQSAGKKRYGIQLRGSLDGELRIAGVEAGSPAEAGGLQAGDLVISLNGVVIAELETSARMSALRGSPLVVGIERDGEVRELTLRLE